MFNTDILYKRDISQEIFHIRNTKNKFLKTIIFKKLYSCN